MPCSRIVALVLAGMAVIGVARAQSEGAPMAVDAARQDEDYVIQPGAEPLFAEMLGNGQTLPGGCAFSSGQIARTSVLATYTCGGEQVVLQLLHPESAPSGGVRTQRFVITVKSGVPPAALVEAVADRVRAREAAFEWTRLPGRPVGGRGTLITRSAVEIAVGAVVAIVLFWALRRLAARRRRPD